jgi:hypothetical protein
MEIETKNASLDTLAVTILALHVSGKQMTQAVFKQLPEGKESDDSELWGIVRYSIKESGDLWIVFSSGGRLFRRALDLTQRFARKRNVDEAERLVILAKQHLENPGTIMDSLMKRTPTEATLERLKAEAEEAEQVLIDAKKMYQQEVGMNLRAYRTDNKLAGLRQLFIAV